MADYDKVIAPGGSGRIFISVKTDAYFSPIVKRAEVTTNDPENRLTTLQIQANVVNYIKVAPPHVYIRKSGGAIQAASTIISTDRKKPLALEVVSFNIPEKVKYTIEETQKGKQFKVKFSHIAESEKPYSGILILKTNYKDKPILRIFVKSRFE